MKSERLNNVVVLRLDIGDEICNSVKKCCEEYGIKLASVSGIGVTKSAVIGLYDLEKQEFIANEMNTLMEIATLTGNVTTMNAETYIHLHAVLCDEEGKAFGGHLKEGVIGATCEIFINAVEGEIGRVYQKETGLNILEI